MADDMDATLQKVLDTLGMTEQAVRPIPPPNNATLKPPSMVKHGEYSLPASTIASFDISEGSGDRNLDQQHATSLPVTEQGHCLPHSGISGMSSIPQHNNYSIVALEGDQSDLTEDSPGSILNSWIFDLDFGTHITPSASDMQQQQQQQRILGSSPNDELVMPPTGQVEFIEPVYTESGSTLFKQPTSTSDIEGLVDEISDRVGTLKIGLGGKTRFYGPTSTFSLTEMPFLDNYEANQPKPIYHSESEEEIPMALEDHLLNLYFSWQDPSFHVVDRDIYEEAKENWGNLEETPYYSEALRNAM
jgi:hypothetical protein